VVLIAPRLIRSQALVSGMLAEQVERSAPDRTDRVRKGHRYSSAVQFRIRDCVPVVPLDDPCPTPSGAVREPSVSTLTRPGLAAWTTWGGLRGAGSAEADCELVRLLDDALPKR
jgi:hypothetical protein